MPKLSEIAAALEGELHGPADLEIAMVGPHTAAESGQIAVAFNAKALAQVEATQASAVVLPENLASKLPYINVAKPPEALLKLLYLFAPTAPAPAGIHPTAVFDPSVQFGADVTVGPYAVIEAGAVLGARCRIGAHCVIGPDVRLGDDVVLYPHVTLYDQVLLGNRVTLHSGVVIGGNGFGYLPVEGRYERIPQLGSVVLEDDVELGCNVTVDRATMGITRIGRGTKFDDHVHVGHNASVGSDTVIAAQTGIAGSSHVGNNCVLGGQVGIGDHINIGDGVKMGSQSGTIRSLPDGVEVMGTLPLPLMEYMKLQQLLPKLRELFKRVEKLEKPK